MKRIKKKPIPRCFLAIIKTWELRAAFQKQNTQELRVLNNTKTGNQIIREEFLQKPKGKWFPVTHVSNRK
jgi:hypothetical protein